MEWALALDFIRRDRPLAANRIFDRVEQALRRLEDFPNSGRRIPGYADENHREILVLPFRFFYRVEKDAIVIFAVYHQAQLPET